MNDIGALLEIVAYAGLIVVPTILLVRFLAGGAGVALADLFARSIDQPWPRGVQEGEPVHWRIEYLRRPELAGGRSVSLSTHPEAGRAAAGPPIESRRCA